MARVYVICVVFSLSYFQEADKDCSTGLKMEILKVKRCEDRDELNFCVLKTASEFFFWYSNKQMIS